MIAMKQYLEKAFLEENMMGPNAIKLLKQLTQGLRLNPSMRVLDLGCGRGLTSLYLADKFGVDVFATDLWISATDNYERFKEMELEHKITPIHADALCLPFANAYFDAVFSVDAYHYFGRDEHYLDNLLAPLLKEGGIIALAFPGLKQELGGSIPVEMQQFWTVDDIETWHSCDWWKALLAKSQKVEILSVQEMGCFDECWQDWLACEEEHAVGDRLPMAAGAGKYMNFVSVIGKRRPLADNPMQNK